MLFSHPLLLFLFTTFVAAAPTTNPPKKYDFYHDLKDFEIYREFIADGGGEWIRVPATPFGVEKLRFAINRASSESERRYGDDFTVKIATSPSRVETLPVSRGVTPYLVKFLGGTEWERKDTGSKIKIIQYCGPENRRYQVYYFELLEEGRYGNLAKEEIKRLDSTLEQRIKEHKEGIAAMNPHRP